MRGAVILGAPILGAMAATAIACAYEDVQPGTPADAEARGTPYLAQI